MNAHPPTSCPSPRSGFYPEAVGAVIAWNLDAGVIHFLRITVLAPSAEQVPTREHIRLNEVAWAQAVAVIDAPARGRWISTEAAAASLNLSRDQLDQLVVIAPPDLPGAPVDVRSEGASRRQLRWDRERLDEWFAALGRWRDEHQHGDPSPRVARPQEPTRSPKPSQRRPSLTARLQARDDG